MSKKLVNAWTLGDKVGILFEDENGRRSRQVIPANWYFIIERKDHAKASKLARDSALELRSLPDPRYPDYVKVQVNEIKGHPIQERRREVVLLFDSHGIQTYEGDLPPHRRWYIDHELEMAPKESYSRLYFDIETSDVKPRIEIGKERILSFAAVDQTGKKYFTHLQKVGDREALSDESEKEMLEKILEVFVQYDIILGWNSTEFDVPYLKDRMRLFGLNKTALYKTVWKEVTHYDLLPRARHTYKYDTSIRNFSLDYIANHFIGKGKIKHENKKIIDLFMEDLDLLGRYNLEDCILLKEIDEKCNLTNNMILQASWCGVPGGHFGLYKIIDALILRIAHNTGKFERTSIRAIMDDKKKEARRKMAEAAGKTLREYNTLNADYTDTDKKNYLGGLVLDPDPGYYKKVYTFDYKSLYPTSMKTINVGHETLMLKPEEGCIINPGTLEIARKTGEIKPTYFKKHHSSIYLALTEVMEKRKEYKKRKLDLLEKGLNRGPDWDIAVSDEIIVKEISNSIYGIMGMVYGRYYSEDIAESITLCGQWMIKYAKKHFEAQGFRVIYGDTDSIFVSTENDMDIKSELDKYHKALTETLKKDYNIDEHFIELEFDKEYDGFILITKKTYCGHMVNFEGKKVDEIYSKGVEFKKRGTFGFASDKQKELVNLILSEPSKAQLRKWLLDVKHEFFTRDFKTEELSISHKVGKNLDDYSKKRVVNTKRIKKLREDQMSLFNPADLGPDKMTDERPLSKASIPLHVRIAMKIKEKTGEFYKNTEVEYIVTGHDDKLEGVHVSEFNGNWDKDYYWENKTIPLLERIVSVTNPEIDFDVLYNTPSTLFDSLHEETVQS